MDKLNLTHRQSPVAECAAAAELQRHVEKGMTFTHRREREGEKQRDAEEEVKKKKT